MPPPGTNLIKQDWAALDSDELRVLLDDRLGGPRHISGAEGDQRLFLPRYGPTCRLVLRFEDTEIRAVEAGPAFDDEQWAQISSTIETLLSTPSDKIGRDFAFARRRVIGTWLGADSGVQILPPPPGAPSCPAGSGSHPFVLEFPIHSDTHFSVMNARRVRETGAPPHTFGTDSYVD